MSHFEYALPKVKEFEGGFVNNKDDLGGATNFGITIETLSQYRGHKMTESDVRGLKWQEAREIYQKVYWKPIYDSIASKEIAAKIFDMAVNMGHKRAHNLLQQALNIYHDFAFSDRLKVDGVFGRQTLAALNLVDVETFLKVLRSGQNGYYEGCFASRPRNKTFINGWRDRALA